MTRILALLLLLVLPGLTAAQDMPAPLTDTVSDFANLFDPAWEDRLTKQLKAVRQETGVQIVVVTMDQSRSYGSNGQQIETFGTRLFNHWGVGDAQRNDGIMLLIATEDRASRIVLGDGFDQGYNRLAQQVITKDMLPQFRNGLYALGIQNGVTAVIDTIARPFATKAPAPQGGTPTNPVDWLIGLAVLAGLALAASKKIGDLALQFRACPACGARSTTRTRTVEEEPTAKRPGSGRLVILCRACNHREEQVYAIAGRREDDSDEGGGFGGGRSSGGGASGRW